MEFFLWINYSYCGWLNPYHADDNYYAYCKLINFDIIMGGALYS